MSTPTAPSATTLAQRYGSKRRKLSRKRKLWLIAVAAVLVLFFISWLTFGKGPTAENKLLGYQVTDATQTVIEFQVNKPATATAQCAVQALDNGYAVVGWKVVTIPPNADQTANTSQRVELRTDALAVTATVDSCWIAKTD
ncbi:MAG: DUF4307 domain-containing protein [Renibacterium salmoninarum]|nr:DUF4307 domain-containing protein [Renibacterium salmoninarum]